MPWLETPKVYKTLGYARQSKRDPDKESSEDGEYNSIANQKELISQFVARHKDLELMDVVSDDGYTGTNFDRPGIQQVLEAVRLGMVNCIVVKDLSRFGRQYIEAGRYLQQVFPFLGVRFISINDGYDSLEARDSDDILLPIKNLLNDSYSRDISVKVRSQLEIRRKKGDFVGSFPVYGYLRSPENKNKLVPDQYAADIVRRIFQWKIQGRNNQNIAEQLNQTGILSPLEYKNSLQWNYQTPFKRNAKALWSATAVQRILQNPVYTGEMIQGRESTPNYKVKKRFQRPQEQWSRVADTHEAIVSVSTFERVKQICLLDTRTNQGQEQVYPFSGLLRCAHCQGSMVRKIVPGNGKNYIYYICGNHKKDKTLCGSHRISEARLSKAVLATLRKHIRLLVQMKEMREYADALPLLAGRVEKTKARLLQMQQELDRHLQTKYALYGDYARGFLREKEYLDLKEINSRMCADSEQVINVLKENLSAFPPKQHRYCDWIEDFLQAQNITKLDRVCLILLVERIDVMDGQTITIRFRYQDEFMAGRALLQQHDKNEGRADNG